MSAPRTITHRRFGTDPRLTPTVRVEWWDWRNHHDWIGHKAPKKGAPPARRRQPPIKHAQDFLTREFAEQHIAKLRRQVPADELIIRVIDLTRKSAPSPPVQTLLLPGPWPLQRPGAPMPPFNDGEDQ
jgi:hypothetical protein